MASLVGAASFLAAGGFAAAALTQGSPPPPTRTVTVDVATGAQGPTGPAGPKGDTGPQGPPGAFECLAGYSPGLLVINGPHGQVTIYTCIKD